MLPFLDRERLKKAMIKADNNEKNLSAHERERNKVTGDIRLFFNPTPKLEGSKMLVNLEKGSPSQFEANFKSKD